MFAPEGYVSIDWFLDYHYSPDSKLDLHKAAETYIIKRMNAFESLSLVRRDDLILGWLLDHVRSEIYAQHGTGAPKRINDAKALAGFNVAEFVKAIPDTSLETIPENIRQSYGFCDLVSNDQMARYAEHRREENYERTKDKPDIQAAERHADDMRSMFSEQVKSRGFANVPLFYNRGTGTLDSTLFECLKGDKSVVDWLAKEIKCDPDKLANMLSGFQDHHLIVPERLAGTAWENYCKERVDKAAHVPPIAGEPFGKPSEPPSSGRGRPQKQLKALNAYDELYPDGHNGSVWKDVVKKVSEKMGEEVSKDTIKRALNGRKKPL